MAYVCRDKDGTEMVCEQKPYRGIDEWAGCSDYVLLPKGSIAKLIGHELTWDDEPVKLVETKE